MSILQIHTTLTRNGEQRRQQLGPSNVEDIN